MTGGSETEAILKKFAGDIIPADAKATIAKMSFSELDEMYMVINMVRRLTADELGRRNVLEGYNAK